MIERRVATEAVATLLADATGTPVGRGKIPTDDSNIEIVPPYYILDSVGPLVLSGAPFADMNEDASITWQITAVSGPDPGIPQSSSALEQAEWHADRARTALLGRDPATGQRLHPLNLAGWKDMCRDLDSEPGATNDPADAIISYVLRVRFDLTPS